MHEIDLMLLINCEEIVTTLDHAIAVQIGETNMPKFNEMLDDETKRVIIMLDDCTNLKLLEKDWLHYRMNVTIILALRVDEQIDYNTIFEEKYRHLWYVWQCSRINENATNRIVGAMHEKPFEHDGSLRQRKYHICTASTFTISFFIFFILVFLTFACYFYFVNYNLNSFITCIVALIACLSSLATMSCRFAYIGASVHKVTPADNTIHVI
jgi:hypothetical protein